MAQYRSTLLIVVWLTVLGLSPSPSRSSVYNGQTPSPLTPSSPTERSLLPMANRSQKLRALELAQANDSKATEEKEKKKEKKADSGVPKPVRVVLRLLRGRKTLLALSLMSVLITGMAVFILLKLFDDSQPEDEEAYLPPEEENLERSPQAEVDPDLEEEQSYFEATEPVFQREANFPHAAGVADKSVTPPRPKIAPLPEEEVVVETWGGISEKMPPTPNQRENKDFSENDNNGAVPTVLQPPPDVETEIQTKLQEEDSYASAAWESSTPAIAPEISDRPQDGIQDTVGRVSQGGDREPTDSHRAEIELRKEAPPAPPVNVVEQLIEELQNTNQESRQNAIWQLGEKGDSRAIEPLVNLLRDSDSKQQSMILASLSQIGNKTLKPMVRALSLSLQNDNQEVRVNAIRDLTDVYEVVISITNILQYAVDDPDDKVRETAKWALEKLNRIRPPRNLDL